MKDEFKPYPLPRPSPIITYPIWDSSIEKEVYVSKTMDQLIENPDQINLSWFGLHCLNSLRINRNLPPFPPQKLKGVHAPEEK